MCVAALVFPLRPDEKCRIAFFSSLSYGPVLASCGPFLLQFAADLLPPPQEEGPDDQGIKTVTTFRRNDKGQVEKVRSGGVRGSPLLTRSLALPSSHAAKVSQH
jgi:hypothetical protein